MASPRRILVIAEGQLGDLILLTPALRAMRESFPHVHISALVVRRRRYSFPDGDLITVNPRGGTSAVIMPFVDQIVEVDRERLRALRGVERLAGEAAILRTVRKAACDAVVCTFPDDRFVLWGFLSGARRRVGQRDQPLHMLLTETPRIRREERGVLRYYTSLAESLGATVVSYRTQVSPTEEHRRRAREMLAAQGLTGDRPIMAVHPGASGAFNVWPPERFAALSETVRERGLADVVICGAPFDRGAVAAVRTAMTKPVHVLEFTDDVLDLASVFERCRLVVCNDSGPWHLALAVGAATLVFMARFKDQSWHVYRDVERCVVLQGMDRCVACPPDFCRNVIPPGEEFGNTCIRMIGVDRAVDQAMKLLGG